MEVEDGIDAGFAPPAQTSSPSAAIFAGAGVDATGTGPPSVIDANKGKSSRGQRSSAASEEKRKCKGCLKFLPASELPLSSLFCLKDKRALDVIAKQSRANDDTDRFYKEARLDPEKVVKLLERYHRLTPPGDAKRARSQFSVMQYMEQIVAESSVTVRSQGKLMNEDEYYTFAQGAERGALRLTKTQACEEWLQMMSDEAVLEQSDKGIAMCAVSLGTFINRDHAVNNVKVVSLKGKETKNVDETAIAGFKKKMLRDHDKGIGRGEEADFEGIARGLVANPSPNKFAGAGAYSIDIQGLLSEDCDPDEDEPGTGTSSAAAAAPLSNSSAAGDLVGDEDLTGTARSRRRFDCIIAVTSAQRLMNLGIDKIQSGLEEVVSEVGWALTAISAKGPEESVRYQKEADLANVRLVFAKAVLANEGDSSNPDVSKQLTTLIAGIGSVQVGGALGTGGIAALQECCFLDDHSSTP